MHGDNTNSRGVHCLCSNLGSIIDANPRSSKCRGLLGAKTFIKVFTSPRITSPTLPIIIQGPRSRGARGHVLPPSIFLKLKRVSKKKCLVFPKY